MADLKSTLRRGSVVIKFWSKVGIAGADDCWAWRDKPDEFGYGRLFVSDGKVISFKAHRVAAALFLPDYSDDLVVRHRCDNPICTNPRHLLMGTQADNIKDREARGRGNHEAKLPNILALAEARRGRKNPHNTRREASSALGEPPGAGAETLTGSTT